MLTRINDKGNLYTNIFTFHFLIPDSFILTKKLYSFQIVDKYNFLKEDLFIFEIILPYLQNLVNLFSFFKALVC